ncbi:MAG: hypothetical protein N2049_07475 [Anaerolineales bacterium]|nr:hypothetical protein [Anaerolineales bacterium]MDW8226620.1 hypothetical protein [Anaerolineales bacterium]
MSPEQIPGVIEKVMGRDVILKHGEFALTLPVSYAILNTLIVF